MLEVDRQRSPQIIIRARENHLFEKYRSSHANLTQELLEFVTSAWVEYVQTQVSKGLPSPLAPGKERNEWSQLQSQFQDKVWKADCLKRDAKFEMHFNAAVCVSGLRDDITHELTHIITDHQNKTLSAIAEAEKRLTQREVGLENAQALIDSSKGILAYTLDKKVRLLPWVSIDHPEHACCRNAPPCPIIQYLERPRLIGRTSFSKIWLDCASDLQTR